jgi:hypothetical protein
LNKFPKLCALMASLPKPMTKTELSKIINKAPAQVTLKLRGDIEFKLSEIIAIVEHFKKYYPDITAEKIFYPIDNYS